MADLKAELAEAATAKAQLAADLQAKTAALDTAEEMKNGLSAKLSSAKQSMEETAAAIDQAAEVSRVYPLAVLRVAFRHMLYSTTYVGFAL